MSPLLGLKKRYYNLIFLCHEFPPIGGGAATALKNLSENLAEQGHHVTVLTIGPAKPLITLKGKKTPNLTVISLGNIRKNPLCPSFLEFIASYFVLKFKAPLYINSLKPDAVISFFAFPAGRAIWPYLQKHNVPHIVSIRGVDAPGFYEERLGGIIRYLMPYLIKPVLYSASAIYGNGKRLKNLVEGYFKDLKIFNIPNGVVFDTHTESREKSFSTYNLIYVGQLIERKRIQEALRGAIFFAKNTSQKVNFTIVGMGGLESTLRKIANTAPPNLKIWFKGYMSREELSLLYNQQHVMIHLSQDEGLSNTLLEAFSKGLAVLASESVAHELPEGMQFPGTILRSFSPQVIAKGVADLFVNLDALNQNFSRSMNIAREFSWENNAQKLLDLIENVLKEKNLSVKRS